MARQTAQELYLDSRSTSSGNLGSLRGARILFLVDEISAITAGGTERQILQILDICKRSGMHPQVCTLRGTRWLTAEFAGCPVIHFHVERVLSWRGLRSLVRLVRWMSAQKVDILQSFFSDANLIGPILGRLAGIPIILGTRRNLNHPRKDDPKAFLLRLQSLVNPLASLTIANSQAVLERIVESEHVARERICVVYNGIDLTHMRPAPELRMPIRKALGIRNDQILVGNVSGLRAIKGVVLFVDAAAEAYRNNPRLRFVLVGDGEMKSEIEESIRTYGLEEIVRLVGAADDVRPYLAAFDVAVLSSHAEGFSNSLLEYMACGVPVVATDVGGNQEALGPSGLLIRPDVHELAHAIQTMSVLQTRIDFANAALGRVKGFDLSIATRRMTDLYSQLLIGARSKNRPVSQFIAHMLARPLEPEEV